MSQAHHRERVLVVGGTGFIGTHVVRELERSGREVVMLVRPRSRVPAGVPTVPGDLLDPDSLRAALKGVGDVVHVAGLVSTRKRLRRRIHAVNVQGAHNLVQAVLRADVRRLVFTSTSVAIGALRGDRPEQALDEDGPFDLGDLAIPYVEAKRAAHVDLLRAGSKGLPVVLLSPTLVLGPGELRPRASELITAFVRRRFPGYLDGGVNPVDVRDVAKAYVAALDHPRPELHYLLAGPENLNLRELFLRLEQLSGLAAPRRRIPRAAALLGATLAELVLPSEILTATAVRLNSLYWYFDAARARRDLGWAPRPVNETLEAALAWALRRDELLNDPTRFATPA